MLPDPDNPPHGAGDRGQRATPIRPVAGEKIMTKLTPTTLGTICHNDDNAADPDHRRVEVWMDEDGVIWADRNSPHRPDMPEASSYEHAIKLCRAAWGGAVWDWRTDDAALRAYTDSLADDQADRVSHTHFDDRD